MSGKILEMILSFPFKQLGEVLRKLSLASEAGNIAAWILYVVICLIPTGIFVSKLLRKKNKKEDLLLLVISLVLFYVMYVMINPWVALDTTYLIEGYIGYGALGGIVYSALIGYLVLKLVRKFKGAKQKEMCEWLSALLWIVNIVLVFNIIFTAEGAIDKIKNVSESNYDEFADIIDYMNENKSEGIVVNDTGEVYDVLENDEGFASDFGLMEYEYQGFGTDVDKLVSITQLILVVRFIVSIIPIITTIIVIIMVQKFLKEYCRSGLSEETITCGNMVSKVAVNTIIINVLANVGFNILQMIFFGKILDIYTRVELPLNSLIFILSMPLITKLITSSKEIKEENEMFV